MDDSLAFAGLGELAVLLRRRDISPVELADFFIERIEQYDPAFNAYIEVTAERAGARRRKGDGQRPFSRAATRNPPRF
jgi:amidase